VDDGIPQLHGFTAVALLAVTFATLIFIASNEVRKKRADKARKAREAKAALPPDAGTDLPVPPSAVVVERV
jgi:hypothetical protein